MWFSGKKHLKYSQASKSLTLQIYEPILEEACENPSDNFLKSITGIVSRLNQDKDMDLYVVVVDIIKYKIKDSSVAAASKYYYLQARNKNNAGPEAHM